MAAFGTPESFKSKGARCWFIIGLGNPGSEYKNTYHNVGFRVVEALNRCLGRQILEKKGKTFFSRIQAYGNDIVLVQPQTYMNRSGSVLPMLFDRFGRDSRILVVSDDLALPLGRIRIRERGSAGGHNGLKSIDSAVGSSDFFRVRVGIDSGRPIEQARDFVLSDVTLDDVALLERAEKLAARAVTHILNYGVRAAMTEYNGMDLRDSTATSESELSFDPDSFNNSDTLF